MKAPLHFAVATLLLLVPSGLKAQADKPNVVVVMADDIGLGDLSFYQRQGPRQKVSVETPNLDQLISEGMRFSDAHSPSSLCAPSRFSMLTGNFSYRNYRPAGVWTPDADSGIEPKFTTSARLAKAGGYSTAFFGKWGMGSSLENRKKPSPELAKGALYFGFDYAVELPQGIQNAPFAFYENKKWMPLKPDSSLKMIERAQIGYEEGGKHEATDGLGDSNWDPSLAGPILATKAVDYIAKQTADRPDAPFFLYYCSQAVHVPHMPPKELDGVRIAGSTSTVHGDMVRELDVQVGMIIKALRKAGAYEKTLFIFTSDNGGTSMGSYDSSNGLKGKKGSINEGGHRVPFVAVWPGKIQPNTESAEPIVGHDVVATLAALAGQKLDRKVVVDSIDLRPILTGQEVEERHRYLMHQSTNGPTYALREGPWKLIMTAKGATGKAGRKDRKKAGGEGVDKNDDPTELEPIALFNLETNLVEDESKNQVRNPEQSQRVEQMKTRYLELRSTGASTLSN